MWFFIPMLLFMFPSRASMTKLFCRQITFIRLKFFCASSCGLIDFHSRWMLLVYFSRKAFESSMSYYMGFHVSMLNKFFFHIAHTLSIYIYVYFLVVLKVNSLWNAMLHSKQTKFFLCLSFLLVFVCLLKPLIL